MAEQQQARDLSDYPTLSLYEVAEEWEKETGKPVIILLHQIAVAIYDGLLKLDIDDRWKLLSHHEAQVSYRPTRRSKLEQELGIGPLWSGSEVASRWQKPIYKPWTTENSPCIQKLKEPPPTKQEPRGLKAALYREGITIKREHFRTWCLAVGYHPLPRFWFGSEAAAVATTAETAPPNTRPEESHGKQLAEQRHAPTRPSATAINEVVGIIRNKDERGEQWHQLTEVDAWMKRNPTSKASRNQFKKLVKDSLLNVGITPINGRPPKK